MWKKKRDPYKMDGILEIEELIEFIRLHEHGVGLGGRLEDGVGCIARMMMVQQEDVQHWKSVVVLHSDPRGGSTTFQRYANTGSESSDILSPMAESSRGSSNGTTRGLRRRTNRSSEAFPGTFSEKRANTIVPNSSRRDSTAERVVDQSSCQIEDRPLGDIPLNQVSTASSRQRFPSKFDQVDGPSIRQVGRLSLCDMADDPLRQKGRSTSDQRVEALVATGQPARSPLFETAHCSNWKNLRSGCRSASTGTIPESQDPSCSRNAYFWTSGHMPRSRQSVCSYFKVEDRATKVSKMTD